jgi:hypothetical protein
VLNDRKTPEQRLRQKNNEATLSIASDKARKQVVKRTV